jgi:SAM-dependent methyltransferase
MHPAARDFMDFIQSVLADYFNQKVVLDVGSGDINGNNRYLFTDCLYEGNDVVQAPNVTVVSKTKDLSFADGYFDTIISTECFEHDPEYRESLKKIYKMLRPGGLFAFTCASTGRPEHGTRRTSPQDSYGSLGKLADMHDYYKNLTIKEINDALGLNSSFVRWNSYYESDHCDLLFVGIKNGGDFTIPGYLPRYIKANVHPTDST